MTLTPKFYCSLVVVQVVCTLQMCPPPTHTHASTTLMANTRCYYCLLSFRAVHEEVVKLDQDFGATFSGVLCDDAGRVRALWGSYAEQVCVCVSSPQWWL